MKNSTSPLLNVLGFTAISIVGWTLYVLLMKVAPDPFANELPRAFARVLVVLLPAIVYISFKQDKPILDFLQLRVYWLRGIIAGLLVTGSYLGLAVIANMHAPSFMLDHSPAVWLNFILGSPIAEELLFRGVLFNELCRFTKWSWAILVSAIGFAILHLPVWILLDDMSTSLLIQSFGNILLYGIIFAGLMKATKSLWAPMAAHCLNNFLLLSIVAG